MSGNFFEQGGVHMEHPIIIDGNAAGSLTVTEDGLFTVFEATLPGCGELLRLSVYGGGREGYLGVMQPWSGGLYLRRRLSRSELRRIPEVIEYAAPAGLCTPAEGGRAAEGNTDGASAKVEAEAESVQLSDEPRADSAGGGAEAAVEHDAPAAENSGEDGLLWFSRPDGTLTAFDGRGSIVAIPAELRRDAPGAVIKKINGRIYMLFRY